MAESDKVDINVKTAVTHQSGCEQINLNNEGESIFSDVIVYRESESDLEDDDVIFCWQIKLPFQRRHQISEEAFLDDDIDFYASIDRLTTKVSEALIKIKHISGKYGDDSPVCEQFKEQVVCGVYEKAAVIVYAIGRWVWIYNRWTVRNGIRIRLKSDRTKQCVKSCMTQILNVCNYVENTVNDVNLSVNSVRIMEPKKRKFEKVVKDMYVTDDRLINRAVRLKRLQSILGDILWLTVMCMLFYLV